MTVPAYRLERYNDPVLRLLYWRMRRALTERHQDQRSLELRTNAYKRRRAIVVAYSDMKKE